MKIDVAFLPDEIVARDISDTVCIVLDIFRATSCIVTAFQHGCHSVIPALSLEEASVLFTTIAQPLLAGERHSLKLEGFHFGNSPFEFSQSLVAGKDIIMTTSNGTSAIRATESAAHSFIGSFLNAAAVCRKAQGYDKDVLIVCAGTGGVFSLEDALCAGLLVKLLYAGGRYTIKDAALAALLLYEQTENNLFGTAVKSTNGQRLLELDRLSEIKYCLNLDIFSIVPCYRDGKITNGEELVRKGN